jgi:hypothetical protein
VRAAKIAQVRSKKVTSAKSNDRDPSAALDRPWARIGQACQVAVGGRSGDTMKSARPRSVGTAAHQDLFESVPVRTLEPVALCAVSAARPWPARVSRYCMEWRVGWPLHDGRDRTKVRESRLLEAVEGASCARGRAMRAAYDAGGLLAPQARGRRGRPRRKSPSFRCTCGREVFRQSGQSTAQRGSPAARAPWTTARRGACPGVRAVDLGTGQQWFPVLAAR